MSKINTPPIGLQDFLGSKNYGENPAQLGQVVSPMLDLAPFFGVYEQDIARDTGVLTGRGIAATVEVPEGEAWYLLAAGGRIETAAAAAVYAIAIELESAVGGLGATAGLPLAMRYVENGNLVSGDLYAVTFQPPQPVILGPGSKLNLHVYKSIATNQIYQLVSWFYKLTI